MEIASLVASVVSVVIGGFAIWLSVTFYRMATNISEDTREASKAISSSVDRLESLFDRLYSDTFSMMKDTVSDMRKHIWPEKEQDTDALAAIEAKADDKVEHLRADIAAELSTMMSQVGRTDTKITGVEERLTDLIDKAITQSRRVESEAQEEISMVNVLNGVLQFIQRCGESTVRSVLTHHTLRRRYSLPTLTEALDILVKDEVIQANGSIVNHATLIRMSDPEPVRSRDGTPRPKLPPRRQQVEPSN